MSNSNHRDYPESVVKVAFVVAAILTGMIMVMIVSGCTTAQTQSTEPQPTVEASIPIEVEVAPPPTPTPLPALAWEKGKSDRAMWSLKLRTLIEVHVKDFDTARDWSQLCPTYKDLEKEEKIEVLAQLMVEIARHESSFNPDTVFGEPPPLNVDSVGLFQLSYEDNLPWCVRDRKKKSLQDPINNIQCAVPLMAKFVKKDNFLFDGFKTGATKGLSRYWSVMRYLKKNKQGQWVPRESFNAIVKSVKTSPLCSVPKAAIKQAKRCANIATEFYNDLCAEGRDCQGEEDDTEYCSDVAADKRGFGSLLIENHFAGVKCGAEFVADCLESGVE